MELMDELTPHKKLANLRQSFESWDPRDVPIEDFVKLYREVGSLLLHEADIALTGDFMVINGE